MEGTRPVEIQRVEGGPRASNSAAQRASASPWKIGTKNSGNSTGSAIGTTCNAAPLRAAWSNRRHCASLECDENNNSSLPLTADPTGWPIAIVAGLIMAPACEAGGCVTPCMKPRACAVRIANASSQIVRNDNGRRRGIANKAFDFIGQKSTGVSPIIRVAKRSPALTTGTCRCALAKTLILGTLPRSAHPCRALAIVSTVFAVLSEPRNRHASVLRCLHFVCPETRL